MDISDALAVVMSGLAILFSTIVGLRQIWLSKEQNRMAKEQNSLNERLVKVEETRLGLENEERQKADVRGFSRRGAGGGGYIEIVLENVGMAQATNISVDFLEKDFLEKHGIFEKFLSDNIMLSPNDSAVFARIIPTLEVPDWGHLTITWDNPSGQKGEYSKKVKLYTLSIGARD